MTRFARLLTMALLLAGCDSRAGALSEHDSPADAALDAAMQTAFAAALRESPHVRDEKHKQRSTASVRERRVRWNSAPGE